MENLQRNVLSKLSEREGKWQGKDEFAKLLGLDWEEVKRHLNLCQDDGLIEWDNKTFKNFDFRITAEGYRFLQSTSEDGGD